MGSLNAMERNSEVEAGKFSGTISDYVMRNHMMQKSTLDSYDISLDIFEGSEIGRAHV